MDPQFDGIFINEKPLVEHLIEEERDKKSHDIEDIRQESEKKQRFSVIYNVERQKPDTRRVSKRVKRWRDREIRKEYGIMAKPFATHQDNAIWVIMEKGPVTVRDIAKEMEWTGKYNSISALVATVWAALGNKHEGAAGVLDRTNEAGTFSYFKAKGVDISVEAAIEKFKLVRLKQYQAKKNAQAYKKQTAELPDEDEQTKTAAIEWKEPVPDQLKTSSPLTTAIEEAVATKSFGIDVNVSGQVEVVFRWGGRS